MERHVGAVSRVSVCKHRSNIRCTDSPCTGDENRYCEAWILNLRPADVICVARELVCRPNIVSLRVEKMKPTKFDTIFTLRD
jgi:hypothetical protein